MSRLQELLLQAASDEAEQAVGGAQEEGCPRQVGAAGRPTKRKKSLDDMLQERAALLLETPLQVCVSCVQRVWVRIHVCVRGWRQGEDACCLANVSRKGWMC